MKSTYMTSFIVISLSAAVISTILDIIMIDNVNLR